MHIFKWSCNNYGADDVMRKLVIFLLGMWGLIIFGGGIAVMVLGPLSISGFGSFDDIAASILKSLIAIIMVIVWIVILSKFKNWFFYRNH